jgi:hypothetical protein
MARRRDAGAMHKSKDRVMGICLCLLLLYAGEGLCGKEDPFGPWSVSENAPVFLESDEPAARVGNGPFADETLGQDYCAMLLHFYQHYLSVVTVSHCPMIPSCSNYSMDAFRKHGTFAGVIMTADRLYHEGTERSWAPIVRDGGRVRFLDPVENNDFWWYRENE